VGASVATKHLDFVGHTVDWVLSFIGQTGRVDNDVLLGEGLSACMTSNSVAQIWFDDFNVYICFYSRFLPLSFLSGGVFFLASFLPFVSMFAVFNELIGWRGSYFFFPFLLILSIHFGHGQIDPTRALRAS